MELKMRLVIVQIEEKERQVSDKKLLQEEEHTKPKAITSSMELNEVGLLMDLLYPFLIPNLFFSLTSKNFYIIKDFFFQQFSPFFLLIFFIIILSKVVIGGSSCKRENFVGGLSQSNAQDPILFGWPTNLLFHYTLHFSFEVG